MNNLRVHITARLHDFVLADFREAFPDISVGQGWSDVEIHDRQPEILIILGKHSLQARQIAELPPSVRVLATYSVGLDHIDLSAARARGLIVLNTPDVMNNAVAEAAVFLLLGAARCATANIDLLRSGRWRAGQPSSVGVELQGRTLGIFGMGRIGRRIAEIAGVFGMRIAYCNRRQLDPIIEGEARWYPSLDDMLAEVDALVVAAPATADTIGIINSDRLRLAKPGLLLVNIARGDLVRDDALIAALKNGHVRGAGLDVFANEPDVDPRYFELPNAFLLPHAASASFEARRAMGLALIHGIRDWREGRLPLNQAN